MPGRSPAVLALAVLPWVLGAALSMRPGSDDLVAAAANWLTRDTPGRMTLLAGLLLLGLVALVIAPFTALLLFIWSATVSLTLGSVLGSERLWEIWQRAALRLPLAP